MKNTPAQFVFVGDPATLALHIAAAMREEADRFLKVEPALNLREAAEFLHCTPAHLSANVDRLKIPYRNIGSEERRILVFSRRALDKWLAEGGKTF